MKATDLKQALRYFDPRRPLSQEFELREWYVARAGSPRGRLRTLLETETEPQKVLFVGHRGSGKTTEINMLADELRHSFHTVPIDLLGITGRTTPEYEDLMLAVSTQVTKFCVRERLVRRPLAEPVGELWQELLDWWRQVVAGLGIRTAPEEASVGVKLETVLGEVELGVKQSSQTREGVKFQINQQMPELIRHLDWVIGQAEEKERRLLIVVEGLDKVDLESAENIFRNHAPTITAPRAAMIYTFPLALRHSDHFSTVRMSFHADPFLPNLCTRHADGSDDLDGLDALRRLVMARTETALIDEDALELILRANGGIPVWLVVLMRSASLYALERGSERITMADAKNAIRDLRRDTLAPLKRDDYRVLRERHLDRRLTNDPDEQRLLYNGSLIEYSNDVQWCDAHPVLWALLEKERDDGDEDDRGQAG
jgi:energy-coupling factor transporter ATP-binding protein EcfA2